MSDYEDCWLDTHAALHSTEEFLRQSKGSQKAFSLQFVSSDHIIGNRSATLLASSPEGKINRGEMVFSEPWFSHLSAKGSYTDAQTSDQLKFEAQMKRPGFSPVWNKFENITRDDSGRVLTQTTGEFTRNIFSSDEINTKITDANGNLLLTGHSVIKNPWFFGNRSIHTEYKDPSGNLLGESHSYHYTHKGGPTMELLGGLTAAGGVYQMCRGRLPLGWRIAAVGVGVAAVGYIWPRSFVKTTFDRY